MALLALLVSQLGAQAHAYSHGAAFGTVTAGRQIEAAHDVCKDCLAFAPLLSAAGTMAAPSSPVRAAPAQAAGHCSDSLIGHRPPLAFRSRAPPADRTA
jgi:hypothetical protein